MMATSTLETTCVPFVNFHLLPASILAEQKSYTWTMWQVPAFDELLVSWNAERPLKGHYVILSSLYYRNQWSPWLLYAIWGSQHQYSFQDKTSAAPIHSYQDQIEVYDGEIATGFRLRIEACHGANLKGFHSLFACACHLKLFEPSLQRPLPFSTHLPVPGLSQLSLSHPRSKSLCSPTSTTAVIRYLLNKNFLNPLDFAQDVYDAGFDIYGNWSFNIAQAFVELGSQWQCFYARATGFEIIQVYLAQNIPIVVSVKGQLTGSLLPYSSGHLMVIKGYDALQHQVICMDPAFPLDGQTSIAYPWEEFMQAWGQRRYLAYFFVPQN